MPTATKEELQERAQLVRIHEANCQLEHPSPTEMNFRIAIMKKIGAAYGLKELQDKQITGPAQPTPAAQRPSRPVNAK